ncbi:MAG TPA: DUF2892 domain-containing protein [Alphaproteobacteria bacterium]|nr:DUF2892 domain-containing protein [Alphaproteobacteria bacterium]
MRENIGTRDRVLRVVIGLAVLSTVFWVEGSIRWFGLIGLVPLGTALFGTCPFYAALGMTSRNEDET